MNPSPTAARQHATQTFIKALKDLEIILQSDDPDNLSLISQSKTRTLAARKSHYPQARQAHFQQRLDEAIQDIDQFMAESSLEDN
jgi:hypothetical protein